MATARELLAHGNKWTDRIARLMLPILIERALNNKTITYSDMRKTLSERHQEHRVHAAQYGKPAGKIGDALLALSEEWHQTIPPINAILVNKHTGVPGTGADYYLLNFVNKRDLRKVSKDDRDALVKSTIEAVFDYPQLERLARYFGLPVNHGDGLPPTDTPIEPPPHRRYGGGPEGEAHRSLKDWVANNPGAFCAYGTFGIGRQESYLDSGDEIDVLFANPEALLGIEVKASDAPEEELWRGVFQCIKYRATLRAMRKASAEIPNVRVLLVIEANPSQRIKALAKRLDVQWINVAGLRK